MLLGARIDNGPSLSLRSGGDPEHTAGMAAVIKFLANSVARSQLGPRMDETSCRLPKKPFDDPSGPVDTNNSGSPHTSVLFVCLGNICRSPLAEGIFGHLVSEAGMAERFEVDSAGTGAWHVGERPDARASMVANQHGVELDSRARQLTEDDLQRFDYVIAMDRENLRNIERMADATSSEAEVHLLREFDRTAQGEEVPDPYYGGASGFETVYEMVHRSCQVLLERLQAA